MKCPACGGTQFIVDTDTNRATCTAAACGNVMWWTPPAAPGASADIPAGQEAPPGGRFDVTQGPAPVYGQKPPAKCPYCGKDQAEHGVSWATETRPGRFKCGNCGGETDTAGTKR